MAYPKISIIWLNYNSMKILPLVLQSLESIASIDYPSDRFELIVVDNGSTDGSFESVREFLEKKTGLRKKIIRLDKNLGFTGGNNIGFKARDPESKYVVLLNNDAIPFPESLRDLVECAELRNDIGAVQGVVLDLDSGKVDTAGDMLSELLIGAQLYQGRDPGDVKDSYYVTYADGAYSLYRVEAVRKATGFQDKLFYDEMFAYFDDSVLGLQLWDAGFKIVSVPKKVALHRRSSTFRRVSPIKLYLTTRGYCALYEITNARFKPFTQWMYTTYNIIGRILTSPIIEYKAKQSDIVKAIYLGCRDGIRWGKYILKSMGKRIDIYKAPLIKLTPRILIPWFLGIGSAYGRKIFAEIITKEFEKRKHDYIITSF